MLHVCTVHLPSVYNQPLTFLRDFSLTFTTSMLDKILIEHEVCQCLKVVQIKIGSLLQQVLLSL